MAAVLATANAQHLRFQTAVQFHDLAVRVNPLRGGSDLLFQLGDPLPQVIKLGASLRHQRRPCQQVRYKRAR
jgi:hypothetical protein